LQCFELVLTLTDDVQSAIGYNDIDKQAPSQLKRARTRLSSRWFDADCRGWLKADKVGMSHVTMSG